MIGEDLGPYRVLAKLGEGGMGEVYRARDTKLDRDVAVKILPPSVAGDPERLTRFGREAKTLAALNHSNIAHIYTVEEGGPSVPSFLVMELVEGDDLALRLTRGAMPLEEALPVARQIAEALDAAHDAGIVHRDLKPANIKVRPDGAVKVLDFGLAKALDRRTDAADRTPGTPLESPTLASADMTQEGFILGTAAYMAPEQARGRPVDRRADIWAFGCVLYEMLSGRRAFGGADTSETLTAVLRDVPDWTALPASTPAGLRRLLARCLERDPKRRLRDIGDALQDIDDAASGRSESAGAPVPARLRWWAAAAWAAAGAIVTALAAVAMIDGGNHLVPRVARVSLTPPSDAPPRIDAAMPDLTITPDGRRIIYETRRRDPEGARIAAGQLVVRGLEAFEPAPFANLGQNPQQPFTSPDGAWIGFQTTVGAKVAPVLAKAPAGGGSMVVLCDLGPLGPLRGASWGAAGITFATSQRATGLFRVAAAGGAPTSLTTPDRSQGERDHVWPEALPEGRGTLFAIAREEDVFDIAVLPAGAASWRVVIRGGSSPRYLPTGHVAYVADGVLYGVGFDLQSLSVTTDPVVLVDGVLTKPSGAADVAIAPNGTLAYVPGRDLESPHRLIWLAQDGTKTPLPLDVRNYRRARLSPDGQRVAVSLEDRGATSIWVHDTARDTFTRVTPRDTSAADPVWSPDGRRLAYWSETDKAILMMAADGGGAPVRLARAESGTFYPTAWSPDGATLAFVQELPALDLRGVSTSPPHQVRPLATGAGAQVEAAFSPNGRWIAHVAFDGNVPEIVIGPVGSTDRRWPVASHGRHPAWSTDRELLFREGAAIHRIAIDPATGLPVGRPTKVIDLPPELAAIRPIEPAPAGRFLMLERLDSGNPAAEIRVVLNWFDEVRVKMAGANRRPPP